MRRLRPGLVQRPHCCTQIQQLETAILHYLGKTVCSTNTSVTFKDWFRGQWFGPRSGAVGRHGSIAMVERFIQRVKVEYTRRLPASLVVLGGPYIHFAERKLFGDGPRNMHIHVELNGHLQQAFRTKLQPKPWLGRLLQRPFGTADLGFDFGIDVIEKILRHCGLLIPSTPRAPPPEDGWIYEPDADWDSQPISFEQSGDLTYVDIDEFLATF